MSDAAQMFVQMSGIFLQSKRMFGSQSSPGMAMAKATSRVYVRMEYLIVGDVSDAVYDVLSRT